MHNRALILMTLACAAFFATAFLLLPRSADAQCGSSASSCKNCHEVQAKAPVNTKGVWHTQHAFGDFCEFCHAGNVKAKDQTAAHTGMVEPLADAQGSCQSCHPDNYMERAQTYVTALSVTLGAGGANANATPAAGASGATNASHSGAATADNTTEYGMGLVGQLYPFERQRAVMRALAEEISARGAENINDDLLRRLLDWLRRGADPTSGC